MRGVNRASITRAKDHAIAKFATTTLRDADLASTAWEHGFKDGYRAGLRDARAAARGGGVNRAAKIPWWQPEPRLPRSLRKKTVRYETEKEVP